MANARSKSTLALFLTFSLLGACGGSKPAESAASTDGDKPAASEKPPEATKSKTEAPAASDAKPTAASDSKSKPAADEGPKPSRPPKDILTAPDVIFMLSFNASDMKKVAEEKCDKESGGDPKKNAECMSRARKQVDHDGFRFKQDKGSWWWLTIKRNGNTLITLHRIPIEFGAETPTSITIKPTGKDEGVAPMKPPAEIKIEIPNDFEIVRNDPKQGRLVYEAKIGITE